MLSKRLIGTGVSEKDGGELSSMASVIIDVLLIDVLGQLVCAGTAIDVVLGLFGLFSFDDAL